MNNLVRLASDSTFAPRFNANPISGIALHLRGLEKRFGDRQVLRGIDLEIGAGEFVAVVGRSGCGKTTLLRLVAGLESFTDGEILLDGQTLGPRDDLRLMFQEARLLPWQTVGDNVTLGLHETGRVLKERARQALAEVGLEDRVDDWPGELSGGQRQRVALARALIHRPRLLLLDEPLGALDALTRIEMQHLIERLWREHRFTALLVTHDVAEAVYLADRIVLIEAGEIGYQQPIALPRPRTAAESAKLTERVLQHLL